MQRKVGVLLIVLIGFSLSVTYPEEKMRLAILPFSNVSESTDFGWLSTGIPESLTFSLSSIHNISLVERIQLESILKEQEFSLSDLADESAAVSVGNLSGADTLLVGSFQITGNRVLIALRFMDVSSGEVLTDKTLRIEGKLEEIFTLYKKLSYGIIEKFQVQITPAEIVRLEDQSEITESLKAYEYFTLGKNQYYKESEEGYEEAVGYFQKAIVEDGEFGLVYAYLSLSYQKMALLRGQSGRSGYTEYVEKASEYITPAREYGEGIAQVHKILAEVLYLKGDVIQAGRDVQKSLYLNPMDVETWLIKWRIKGKGDPEHPDLLRALSLDPESTEIHITLGKAYARKSLFPEALFHFIKAFDRDPRNIALHYGFAEVYQNMGWGYSDEAIASYERIVSLSRKEISAYVELIRLYYQEDDIRRCIGLSREVLSENPGVVPIRFFLALALFRDRQFDRAEEEFDKVMLYDPINELLRLEEDEAYGERAKKMREKLYKVKEELGKKERESNR